MGDTRGFKILGDDRGKRQCMLCKDIFSRWVAKNHDREVCTDPNKRKKIKGKALLDFDCHGHYVLKENRNLRQCKKCKCIFARRMGKTHSCEEALQKQAEKESAKRRLSQFIFVPGMKNKRMCKKCGKVMNRASMYDHSQTACVHVRMNMTRAEKDELAQKILQIEASPPRKRRKIVKRDA